MIKRKLKKYKDGGKAPIKRSTDEVPTRNPMPIFDPLNQNFLNYVHNEPATSHINPSPERKGALQKAADIARNPMTALKYKAQGQLIPDYIEHADRNSYDNALDVINPMTYLDAAGRTLTVKNFRDPNQSFGEALGRTALDVGMLYGIGNEFEVGSKQIANPLGNKFSINAEEAAKWTNPGKRGMGANRFSSRAGMSNIYESVPRQPINIPTVGFKQSGYMRVPASGVETQEHVGMVTADGQFKPFMNEPANVKNSPQFEKAVKESGMDYNRAQQEWNSQPNRNDFFRPLEPFHGYRLEQINNTSRVLPGVTYNNQYQQTSQQSTPISDYQVPIQQPTQNNIQQVPVVRNRPAGKKQVQHSIPIQDTMTESPEQAHSRRIEWLHSHNGEEPILDSTRTLDSNKQYGGNINNTYMKKIKRKNGDFTAEGFQYQDGGQVNVPYLLKAPLSHLGTPIIPGGYQQGGQVNEPYLLNAPLSHLGTPLIPGHMAMGGKLPLPCEQCGGYHMEYGGMMDSDGDVDMMKNGGNWIKGAVNPAHKGFCTPMTKSTCTGKRRQFALTMKKHHGFHKKEMGGYLDEYAPGGFVDDFDPNSPMVPGGQGSTLPASGTMPNPSTGYAQPQTGLYQQETTNTPPPPGVDPNAQWRAGMTDQEAQDNINAGDTSQSTAGGNGRNKLRAYSQGFNNLLGAGLATASFFEDQRNQRNMKGFQRQQGMSDNVFGAQRMNTQGLKGDYSVNEGYFRPSQNTPTKAGNFYPQQQYGGYIAGSEHEMDEQTIAQLKKAGYKLQYI